MGASGRSYSAAPWAHLMIHIICTRGSDGARNLREALQTLGVRVVRHRANRRRNPPIRPRDLVVCWGEALREALPTGARVLNNTPGVGKWEELALLREANVPTPEFRATPPTVRDGWLPRRNDHMGGHDLLHPGRADYWVRKVDDIVSEFRVHVISGVSARAGIKTPREGFPNPHPWIRSYDAGWRLEYGTACQESIRQVVRDAAKAAVTALRLDFGAVDIARRRDGSVVVFEVNRAPGLEGNTTKVYAEKLREIHASLQG